MMIKLVFSFLRDARFTAAGVVLNMDEMLIPKTADYYPLFTNEARVSHVIVRITRLIRIVIRPQYMSNIML